MADITDDCTLEYIETLGKSKFGVITCINTSDDQDYIVLNTLTGEDLVPSFAVSTTGYANVFSGLTTDASLEPMAWDTTVLVIKLAQDNVARKILFLAESDESTGGD